MLADGSLHRVHANSEPELFWALRGGGGSFGVVTALEFELLPLAEVYAGVLLWDDPAVTGKVARAWAKWTHGLPEEATTSLRLLGRPGVSGTRNVFPGRQVVVIDGAVLGDPALAARLLAPLRALDPSVDTFTATPAVDLTRLHFDPELPSAGVSSHLLLDDFDVDAAAALVAIAGADADTSLVSAEIRQLGGALGRPAAGGGALNQVRGSLFRLLPRQWGVSGAAHAGWLGHGQGGRGAAAVVERAPLPQLHRSGSRSGFGLRRRHPEPAARRARPGGPDKDVRHQPRPGLTPAPDAVDRRSSLGCGESTN